MLEIKSKLIIIFDIHSEKINNKILFNSKLLLYYFYLIILENYKIQSENIMKLMLLLYIIQAFFNISLKLKIFINK